MEINVLEDTSERIVFELPGAGHTLCNVLKKELWKDGRVKVATYAIAHPLKGIPQMVVETDGSAKPVVVIKEAIKKVSDEAIKFSAAVKKL